jgi:hypothetical protein
MAKTQMPGTSYMWLQDSRPPWVRIEVVVACTELDNYVHLDRERARFVEFLEWPQVMSLVKCLTHVPQDHKWIAPSGSRFMEVDAVLAPAEDAEGVASARLLLPRGLKPDWRNRSQATLILQVVPRNKFGLPAVPSGQDVWAERIIRALNLSRLLGHWLSNWMGSRITGEPPAIVAIHMEANSMAELIDTTGLDPIASESVGYAYAYFIAAPVLGMRPWIAANKFIDLMLNHARRTG